MLGYGGTGFGGYWYCRGCGSPQLGDPPFKGLGVSERCRACGPGDGFARCPATHGAAVCGLCRGEGWVEAL